MPNPKSETSLLLSNVKTSMRDLLVPKPASPRRHHVCIFAKMHGYHCEKILSLSQCIKGCSTDVLHYSSTIPANGS
jgi:hypothetical protein